MCNEKFNWGKFYRQSLFFLFLLNSSEVKAVPHISDSLNPDQSVCYVNREASQNRLKEIRKFAPGFAPPISATVYSLALIRVDFSDKVMTKTSSQTETVFTNMKNFFLENSYINLTINASVSNTVFRMPKTMSYYASGINSKYSELTQDAIGVATTTGFNFSSFDHIMIYHAGEGAETSTSPSGYIWSAYLPSNLVNGPVASGKTFSGVTFVPELEFSAVDPFGVICHEYGHQLGLPDLYSGSTGESQIGVWSLMDKGVYISTPVGSNPAHLDAWCKLFLGFSSPETITFSEGVTKSIAPAETTRSAFIRLPISVSDVGSANEYFLLEYRRRSAGAYDSALPGDGLLIWHIDDSIASNPGILSANTVNSNSKRRGVDLVEADSSDSSNGGDGGDPWPGTTSNTTFASPKSNAYAGKESGIEVSGISGAGTSEMLATIKSVFNNPAIVRAETPGSIVVTGGAKGYVNPNQGESALIGFIPTASGKIEIKIFSLTGDLVWESTVSGSINQKVVERWNAKNLDSSVVSSGIYLLSIEGGGLSVKKKIAIAK